MTVAVADAIMRSRIANYNNTGETFTGILIRTMQEYGRRYPCPKGAYGGSFNAWLHSENPEPYNSFGNGSAMRASPCGLAAACLEEAQALARASAYVTHNHPEGIKGAEATAAAVLLAKTGRDKAEIKKYICENYYKIDFTLDSIRPFYIFDTTCQGSVPQALEAFFESKSFEDALRNVISIGGDSDTLAAITCGVAWTYYTVQSNSFYTSEDDRLPPDMKLLKKTAQTYLPEEFIQTKAAFRKVCEQRDGTYCRSGFCTPVLSKEESKRFAGKGSI